MNLTRDQENRLRGLADIGPWVDPERETLSADWKVAAGFAECARLVQEILDGKCAKSEEPPEGKP